MNFPRPGRLPVERFEQAARIYATMRGKDPDMLTFFGHKAGMKRPLWVNYAEILRNHYEQEVALEEAGL